jgi:hypothetical protein
MTRIILILTLVLTACYGFVITWYRMIMDIEMPVTQGTFWIMLLIIALFEVRQFQIACEKDTP